GGIDLGLNLIKSLISLVVTIYNFHYHFTFYPLYLQIWYRVEFGMGQRPQTIICRQAVET
ncbi:MAG: hypothetical protein ACW992_02815, partial [Candidatus Thorarchaeota archaeon]